MPIANAPGCPRAHVYLSFDELAERLGLNGDIVHVWREDDGEYVHISLWNVRDGGKTIRIGEFVEAE